jgi:transposase/uncharacterized ParB-like nuclease family protein
MKVLGVREIPIDRIEVIQGLLPRIYTYTIEEKVEEYKEAMAEGQEFPPIVVWLKNDEEFWLIDGAHRLMASKRLGKKVIRAELVELGSELDARILSIEKNTSHGVPLHKEEKIELARLLYADRVEIEKLRKLFRVSERTIYNWVQGVKRRAKDEELKEKARELRDQGYSLREIARQLDVHPETVRDWTLESVGNLQKLQETDTPDHLEEETDFGNDIEQDDFDYEKLIQAATEKSKELVEYARQRYEEEERKKPNGGRPPNDPPPLTEKEEYERLKNELIYYMEKIVVKIGWDKALSMFEEALEEIKELSKSAKRG